MIGLALEGGGVRGSYQAGVYMAMYEAGIKISAVCGSSIGALNGVVIASGKGEILPSLWRSLRMGHVFGFSDAFIEAKIRKRLGLSLFKNSLISFFKILGNKGISLEGLKEVIDKYLDVDELLNSDIDFGLCTVRLHDLKPLYIWKKDMNPEKIKDYVLASSFLPIFRMEKLIDDHYYLDGGFYDIGPVNMLLEKGCDTVYLVKVHGIGITRKYDRNANVIVIEPKRSLGGVLEMDPNRIEENIHMGYFDTIRVLNNYDGEDYVFKNKSEKYYKFLNRKVPKKLLIRAKNFFGTNNVKDTTIKVMEYAMERLQINYYDIYEPRKVLKMLKKKYNSNFFLKQYIKKLKYFW